MGKLIKVLSITPVLFLYFFISQNVYSAACTLTSASWGQSSAQVGDTVSAVVAVGNPSDCQNQNIGIQIFEEDSLRDDPITANISRVFSGSSNQITISYTLTFQDYIDGEDESGSETIYFTAKVQNQSNFIESNRISFSKGSAQPCVLNSATINGNSGQAVSVGENVNFSVNGQYCKGWEVSFNIYEDDVTGDNFIKTVKTNFPNTSDPNGFSNAVLVYQFTQQDYVAGGSESGSEEMYFEAVVGSGSTQSKKTSGVVPLNESVAGNCQLSSATWKWDFGDQPIVGSPVRLVVTGSGCPNWGVQFDIKEQDTGLGDDQIATLNGNFNSAGTQAAINWTVDGSNDDDNIGSYEFYFEASAGSARITSDILNDGSGIPLRSENGCLNCNALVEPNRIPPPVGPDPCLCADGTSQIIGITGSCQTFCRDYIGDAQGGAGGSGGGSGGSGGGAGGAGGGSTPGGPGQPGQCGQPDQPACDFDQGSGFSFQIDNPLSGTASNVLDILNLVATWIFNISIPIAVIMILYGGFLFLTAGAYPDAYAKGKKILTYTVAGLAIIFIGKGFITLIISILELGTTSGTPPITQPAPGGGNPPPGSGQPGAGLLGNRCIANRDCSLEFVCGDSICQVPGGNTDGEYCLTGRNCISGLVCDKAARTVIIDGQLLGFCDEPDLNP